MSNDKKIATLRKSIETKRTALGTKPRMSYIGNGMVTTHPGTVVNLNVLNLKTAIEATAAILAKRDSILAAIKLLGLSQDDYDDSLQQCNYDLHDVSLKVDGLVWTTKDNELRQMDKQLADMLSADAKTSNALADFESKLK